MVDYQSRKLSLRFAHHEEALLEPFLYIRTRFTQGHHVMQVYCQPSSIVHFVKCEKPGKELVDRVFVLTDSTIAQGLDKQQDRWLNSRVVAQYLK